MKPFTLSLGSLLLLALFLSGGCSEDDDENGPMGSSPPPRPDTVWVSSVSGEAGQQVKVDITIRNSVAIGSVEVPLRLAGSDFVIDSGSYGGGTFATAFLKQATINAAEKTVYFIAAHAPSNSVPSGTSHLGSLYVTLGAGAGNQVIAVDSAFVPVGGNVYHVVSFATPGLQQILPVFRGGEITVAP